MFLVFHCSLGSKDFCQLYYEIDIVEAILMFYVILLTLVFKKKMFGGESVQRNPVREITLTDDKKKKLKK